jgi:hypothetical protein
MIDWRVRMRTVQVLVIGSFAVVLSGCDDRAAETRESTKGQSQRAQPSQKSGTELDMSDKYKLSVTPGQIPAGKTSRVELSVEASSGLKVNKEYPWRLSLTAADRLSISETEFDKNSLRLKKDRAIAQTFIRARESGEHEIKMNADFSVCNEDRCYRISEDKLSLKLGASGKSTK